MEEGQYVLRFRLKPADDDHNSSSCAPIWAKDYALDELPTEVEAENEKIKKVKEMKTKKEEGDDSSERRRPPSEEL